MGVPGSARPGSGWWPGKARLCALADQLIAPGEPAPPPGLATLSSSQHSVGRDSGPAAGKGPCKDTFSARALQTGEHCVVTCVQSLRAETNMCKAPGHSHARGRGGCPLLSAARASPHTSCLDQSPSLKPEAAEQMTPVGPEAVLLHPLPPSGPWTSSECLRVTQNSL